MRFIATLIVLLFPLAATAETKIIGGCAVAKAENGNYYSKVNAGCPIFGEPLTDGTPDPEPESPDGCHKA